MYRDNVYIASIKDSSEQEFVKIGKTTTRPMDRVKSLQTGSPFTVHLLFWYVFESKTYSDVSRASKIEKLLHKTLDNHRVSGEWFRMTPDAWNTLNRALLGLEEFKAENINFSPESEIKKILNGEAKDGEN